MIDNVERLTTLHDEHCNHEWGPDYLMAFDSGPIEGEWIAKKCLQCNAGTMGPYDGSDGMAIFVAALAAAGCNPTKA